MSPAQARRGGRAGPFARADGGRGRGLKFQKTVLDHRKLGTGRGAVVVPGPTPSGLWNPGTENCRSALVSGLRFGWPNRFHGGIGGFLSIFVFFSRGGSGDRFRFLSGGACFKKGGQTPFAQVGLPVPQRPKAGVPENWVYSEGVRMRAIAKIIAKKSRRGGVGWGVRPPGVYPQGRFFSRPGGGGGAGAKPARAGGRAGFTAAFRRRPGKPGPCAGPRSGAPNSRWSETCSGRQAIGLSVGLGIVSAGRFRIGAGLSLQATIPRIGGGRRLRKNSGLEFVDRLAGTGRSGPRSRQNYAQKISWGRTRAEGSKTMGKRAGGPRAAVGSVPEGKGVKRGRFRKKIFLLPSQRQRGRFRRPRGCFS